MDDARRTLGRRVFTSVIQNVLMNSPLSHFNLELVAFLYCLVNSQSRVPPGERIRGGDQQAAGDGGGRGEPLHVCAQGGGHRHQAGLLLPVQGRQRSEMPTGCDVIRHLGHVPPFLPLSSLL